MLLLTWTQSWSAGVCQWLSINCFGLLLDVLAVIYYTLKDFLNPFVSGEALLVDLLPALAFLVQVVAGDGVPLLLQQGVFLYFPVGLLLFLVLELFALGLLDDLVEVLGDFELDLAV